MRVRQTINLEVVCGTTALTNIQTFYLTTLITHIEHEHHNNTPTIVFCVINLVFLFRHDIEVNN